MINFNCPKCDKEHSAPKKFVGKTATCACGEKITIPSKKEIDADFKQEFQGTCNEAEGHQEELERLKGDSGSGGDEFNKRVNEEMRRLKAIRQARKKLNALKEANASFSSKDYFEFDYLVTMRWLKGIHILVSAISVVAFIFPFLGLLINMSVSSPTEKNLGYDVSTLFILIIFSPLFYIASRIALETYAVIFKIKNDIEDLK